MFSTRLLSLLFLALAVICVVQAADSPKNKVVKRQTTQTEEEGNFSILPTDVIDPLPTETGTGGDTPVTTTTTTDEVTSDVPEETSTSEVVTEPTTQSNPVSVPETTTTSEIPQETSTTEQQQETSTITTDEVTSEAAPPPTSSDEEAPVTTSAPEPTTSAETTDEETSTERTTRAPVVSTSFETITRTNSDGSVQVTTSATVATNTPDLDDGESSGSSGMSANTRNTIIGVVVGIGGAALLGGLAIVAWRIRSRKKAAEENDGLMEYEGGFNGTATDAKSEGAPSSAGGGRSPFQSTLENYHQPTQPINHSSNF